MRFLKNLAPKLIFPILLIFFGTFSLVKGYFISFLNYKINQACTFLCFVIAICIIILAIDDTREDMEYERRCGINSSL